MSYQFKNSDLEEIARLTVAGGGGSPAGNNTEIQYNDNGSFGASQDLTFDGDTLITRGDPGTLFSIKTKTGNNVFSFINANSNSTPVATIAGDNTALKMYQSIDFRYTGLSSTALISKFVNRTLTTVLEIAQVLPIKTKGSGSTSATTNLLLQNSSGTELLKVTDDGTITNINGNTFHSLGTSGQIPFVNGAGDDLSYSADLVWGHIKVWVQWF